MKAILRVLLACALLVSAVAAQDTAARLPRRAWHIGLWAGGGTGLGAAADYKFLNSGARFGRVLTPQLGSSWARGNLEFAVDIIPLYLIWQPVESPAGQQIVRYRQRVYGFGINPVILKWNFTRGRRIAPFIEADGGMLITTREVPAGDTSAFNFTPGGGFGAHFFLSDRRAITFSGHAIHISNASLADQNPGINATLQLRLEYTLFK